MDVLKKTIEFNSLRGARALRNVLTITTGLVLILLLAIGLHSENLVRYGHITNGNHFVLNVAFPEDDLPYERVEITTSAEDVKNGLDRLLVKDEARDLEWCEFGRKVGIGGYCD